MMAVETLETHIEETGRLPYTDAPEEPSRVDLSRDSGIEHDDSVVLLDRS